MNRPHSLLLILLLSVLLAAAAACSNDNEKHAVLPDNNGNGGGSQTDDDADDDTADDDTTDDDTTQESINLMVIYNHNAAIVDSYRAVLATDHITVKALAEGAVPNGDFTGTQVILVDTNTEWFDSNGVAHIAALGVPVIGVYYGGGYLFNGIGLQIGWAGGVVDENATKIRVFSPDHQLFNSPYDLGVSQSSELAVFAGATQLRYHDLIPMPGGVEMLAERDVGTGFSAITIENGIYLYWGFEMDPLNLTEVGREILVNAIYFLSKL
jgi:hypothetical protein